MAQESFEQLLNAVKQAESRGQRFDEKGNLLTSPKGAQGEMQVMPKTARSPGYGVAPAQDKTPDELARVGKDYLQAMLNKYGDTKTALMAYNWGPKNTDNWLAAGADPKKVPAETQKYTKDILNSLGGTKTAGQPAAEPTASEKMMTDALKSGMSAQNLVKDAGPGYKAAMAMMFLSEDKPKTDEEDIWKEAEPEQVAEEAPPSPLEGLDLSYKTPFAAMQPVERQQIAHFASGGLAGAPKVGVKGTARDALDAVKAEYDRYATEAGNYNTALNQYQTDVYNPYKEQVTGYNTALDKYKADTYQPYVDAVAAYNAKLDEYKQKQYQPYVDQVAAYNTALNQYKTETYDPYSSSVDKYNAALAEWNAGPRTTAFAQTAPTLAKTFDMAAPAAPAEFSQAAPSAPKAFEVAVPKLAKTFDMTAPTAPTTTQADYDKMVAAARQDATQRQQALDVASNPEAYGLTINKLFSHGGVVHRAEGSPMGGENVDHLTPQEIERMAEAQSAAFMSPKSGIGRVAGPISQALASGEAYPAMARGVAETPYNVVGAPVDLATLAMRPFGYKEEKPVMGSDWIKEKMTKYGIRPGEEANPTLQGFRTAGELGASVVNPGPVAAKVGQAAEKGAAAVGKEAARQMLRGMEGEGPLAAVSPPVMYAREPGKAAAGPIFSHLPSEEAPFVGRLDEYISNLPGPVQKQQFFGQLKGKFRDYEIGRAEEALKDLPDNAKLTPSDLLNRVKGVYDPGRYKATVINPSEESRGSFYQGMDNPYYDKPTGIGKPLGVIHLNMETTPELEASQNSAQNVMESFRRLLRSNANEEQLATVNDFLQSPKFNALPNAQEMRDKFQTGIAQHEKIKKYMDEVSEVDNMLRYPSLSKEYDRLAETALEKYRGKMHWSEAYDKAKRDTHLALIDKANEWLKKNKYEPVDTRMLKNLPASESPSDVEEFVQAAKNALDPAEQMIRKADQNLSQYLKEPVYAVNTALSSDMPYLGQHSSLKGGNNPISFSRFSEHTTAIPGMGEVKGIYVNELQSDMLDDLRKMGKRGGSKEQDKILSDQLDKEISNLKQKQQDAITSGKGAVAEDLDRQLMAAKQRKDIVSRRTRMGSYDVPEIMHNMETSPQVVQQLMAKNVIGAAIRRGDSFVAFPGRESAQAQLYEKLPHNLKQVVKDLGPGFEIRPIELEGPIGTMSHVGVVWGPEAAARIQKKGVPFATGGAVDKANIDHRKYM